MFLFLTTRILFEMMMFYRALIVIIFFSRDPSPFRSFELGRVLLRLGVSITWTSVDFNNSLWHTDWSPVGCVADQWTPATSSYCRLSGSSQASQNLQPFPAPASDATLRLMAQRDLFGWWSILGSSIFEFIGSYFSWNRKFWFWGQSRQNQTSEVSIL